MSIKKDPDGRRSIQVEIEVPGTPEVVWDAIATGPGVSAWFVPTTSDEREGGQVVSTFGPGMDCPATIIEWEKHKRFVAEAPMGPPGSPNCATEWIVEAREGGTCIVRVVHSLFASADDWDNQLEGLEQGWPAYFRVLRRYLQGFRGQPCSAMHFVSFASDSEADAWAKAGGELGLLNLALGDRWEAPEGFPSMSGTVDMLGHGMHANTMLINIDSPEPGTMYIGAFSCGGMVMVCQSIYLYGENTKAAVERDEPVWQAWMNERFPMPQMG